MQKLGKWIYLFLFMIYFIVFFIMQQASIAGLVYPFAIGLMFALVWAEQKVWLVSPAFLLSAIANDISFESIICAVIAVTMIVVPFYIHVVIKKRIYKWELGIYCLIAQVGNIIFSALLGLNPFVIVAGLVACVLFMYCCIHIFEPILVRGFAYKLTSFELICGAMILIALSDGLTEIDIYGYSVLKTFVAFVLLTISHTTKSTNASLVAGLLGLGSMLGTGNPLYIAPFIIWALTIGAFKSKQRILPFISLICSDL